MTALEENVFLRELLRGLNDRMLEQNSMLRNQNQLLSMMTEVFGRLTDVLDRLTPADEARKTG